MNQPPQTSATASTDATTIARERMLLLLNRAIARPRPGATLSLQREKSGPPEPEYLMDTREYFSLAAACVDDSDRPALRMSRLPLRGCEFSECRRDARVERFRSTLDAVVRAPPRRAREPVFGGQVEQNGEVRRRALRRHPVGGH